MSTQSQPLVVSIITPSFNQGAFIEDTVHSVLAQSYPYIEYIVMDGGSTDDTYRKITPYRDRLQFHVEADNGQADAINKGFRRATGDIFAWLNSDDFYLPNTIATVVQYFEAHPMQHFVYGNGIAVNPHGKPFGQRQNVRPTSYERLLTIDNNILQPAAFWRRSIWEAIGDLNTDLNYTLDYEYWIRIAQQFELYHLKAVLVYERLHTAAKTASGGVRRLQELESMIIDYGGVDLPNAFHAEAQFTYSLAAYRAILSGKWQVSGNYFRTSLRYWHWQIRHIFRVLLFFVASLFGEQRGIVILRLYASRLRRNLK